MLTIEIKSGNIKEYLENMKTYFIKNSNKISNIFRRRGKKKEHKNMNKKALLFGESFLCYNSLKEENYVEESFNFVIINCYGLLCLR